MAALKLVCCVPIVMCGGQVRYYACSCICFAAILATIDKEHLPCLPNSWGLAL